MLASIIFSLWLILLREIKLPLDSLIFVDRDTSVTGWLHPLETVVCMPFVIVTNPLSPSEAVARNT